MEMVEAPLGIARRGEADECSAAPAPHGVTRTAGPLPTPADNGQPSAQSHQGRESLLIGPLAQAFDRLERGLRADLQLVRDAQSSGRSPDWSRAVVVGALPVRYRTRYDTGFVASLAQTAETLRHDWGSGRPSPEGVASFALAVWVLDVAAHSVRDGAATASEARHDLALELGLAAADPLSAGRLPMTEAWQEGWSLEAICVDPSSWFEPAIRTAPRTRTDRP